LNIIPPKNHAANTASLCDSSDTLLSEQGAGSFAQRLLHFAPFAEMEQQQDHFSKVSREADMAQRCG
jgi:hypothetical protein